MPRLHKMKGGFDSPKTREPKMIMKIMREKAAGLAPGLTEDYVTAVKKTSSVLYARLLHLYMSIIVNVPYASIYASFAVPGNIIAVAHNKAKKYIELRVSDINKYEGDKIPGMASIDFNIQNMKKVSYVGEFGEQQIAMIHNFFQTSFDNMFPFPLEGETCSIKLDAIDANNVKIDFIALFKTWGIDWLIPEGKPLFGSQAYRINFNAIRTSPKVKPNTPLLKSPPAIAPPVVIHAPAPAAPKGPVLVATNTTLTLLGRKRKVYILNGVEHVMYQKAMIPLAQAQNIEQTLNKALV